MTKRKTDSETEALIERLSKLPPFTDLEYAELRAEVSAVVSASIQYRTSPRFSYRGRIFTLSQMRRILNSPEDLADLGIRKRIEMGWSTVRAFVTPKHKAVEKYVAPSLAAVESTTVEDEVAAKPVPRAKIVEFYDKPVRRVYGGRY